MTFKKHFVILILGATVVSVFNCGGGSSSQTLTVSISPSSPLESEFQSQYSSFKLTASATGSASGVYSYQWSKNDEAIAGATNSELTAPEMGEQGHTVRGYEFKCAVTSDSATGESSVTIGGPNLNFGRSVLFHNLYRYYALNEGANSSIAALAEATSANWVSIGILYFQSSVDSTTIYEKTDTGQSTASTITQADLIGQIQYARNLGLNVLLYPEIWIDGYSNPGPRDQIAGSADWFTAYQTVITALADIAKTYGVGAFAVGVELNGTEDNEQEWRQLIQAVRNRYLGSVLYAANYATGLTLNWWDALDYIGATCNFGTKSVDPDLGADPTVSQLTNIYAQYRDTIHQVSSNFNKLVFITETGVYSVEGDTADFQEQADYFEAVFETLADQTWVFGTTAIDWFPTQEQWYQDDPNWPLCTSIIAKPAERVINSWFSQ